MHHHDATRENQMATAKPIRPTPWGLMGLTLLAVALVGCARSASLSQWQSSLGQYVDNQANGDLGALRGIEPRDGFRTYTIFSDKDPSQSTDIVGLWMGPHAYDQQRWQIFLIGRVDHGALTAIRLAAVRRDANGWDWQLNEPSPNMLQRYKAAAEPGAQSTNAKPQQTAGYQDWPRPDDAYELQTTGPSVTVIEQHSNARWQLTLPPRGLGVIDPEKS
jgi:hypothetical protein